MVVTEGVGTYRITVNVFAFRDQMDEKMRARVERIFGSFAAAFFPLGVVEGYPDIQEIATESAFDGSA